jgi:cupin superfamily acireductone dioxygenase involved in methionine salvage
MQLQNIKDEEAYKKDEDNGAVLSVDNRALRAYKEKRKNTLAMTNEINNIKGQHSQISYDINNMKQELIEVKELLTNFLSLQKGR